MITYAEVERFDSTEFGRVRLIATGDILPGGDGKYFFFIDLAGHIPQPQAGWFYDGNAKTFSETKPTDAVVPKITLTASKLWMGRLTDSERAKTWAVCNGEAVPGVTITLEQRYRLAAFRDLTLAGEPIPLHAAETVAVINGMEAAAIIGPGRAAIILA